MNETVIVDITSVTNGTESGTQQQTITITDDDPAPTVSLALTGSPMAESGGTSTVTATLSAVSSLPVTVNLTFGGTATNVSDYTRSGTSITIPAGSTQGAVTLTSVADALSRTRRDDRGGHRHGGQWDRERRPAGDRRHHGRHWHADRRHGLAGSLGVLTVNGTTLGDIILVDQIGGVGGSVRVFDNGTLVNSFSAPLVTSITVFADPTFAGPGGNDTVTIDSTIEPSPGQQAGHDLRHGRQRHSEWRSG